jgi:hypothetical protein
MLMFMFRKRFILYGERLLAPRPTPKLEDHPLSSVRGCLFNIFAANLHNWRPLGRPRRRRMDLLEVDWGGVDWIGLAQDRDKWRALVNAVMNLRVP